MNQKDLLIGLNYVTKYGLTPSEAHILKFIIQEPMNVKQVVAEINKPFSTAYHLVHNLEMKGVIKLIKIPGRQGKLYHFIESTIDKIKK